MEHPNWTIALGVRMLHPSGQIVWYIPWLTSQYLNIIDQFPQSEAKFCFIVTKKVVESNSQQQFTQYNMLELYN